MQLRFSKHKDCDINFQLFLLLKLRFLDDFDQNRVFFSKISTKIGIFFNFRNLI